MKHLTISSVPLRNLTAHPVRTLILFLLAAAQAACVLCGVALATNAQGELTHTEDRLGADVLVYPYAASYRMDLDNVIMQGTPVAAWAPRSDLDRMKDCEGITAVSCQTYVPGPEGGPTWVVGYDPATDFAISPWIEGGEKNAPAAGTVLVGCDVTTDGDTVDLYGRSWPVGARLEKTSSELDGLVFMATSDLQTVLADAAAQGVEEAASINANRDYSVALVRVASKNDIERVSNWLKVYLRKTKTVRSDEALSETASGIGWQSLAVGGMAAGAWLVLFAALAVAQSMSLRERVGEFYVWRAAGASRKVVRRIVVREAALVHAAGALAGFVLAALVILVALGGATPLGVIAVAGVLALLLSVVLGCASAAVMVRRATRTDDQMLVVR